MCVMDCNFASEINLILPSFHLPLPNYILCSSCLISMNSFLFIMTDRFCKWIVLKALSASCLNKSKCFLP